MPNQRKHAPVFPLAATIIWIAVAACVVTFFVKALLVRHQVMQDGERIKRLERQLAEINAKNESLQSKKYDLISVPALRKAMASGFLKLLPIDESTVRSVVPPRPAVVAASGEEAH
jgi:hypothetical protein